MRAWILVPTASDIVRAIEIERHAALVINDPLRISGYRMARCRGKLAVTFIAAVVGYSGAARTVVELPPRHEIFHSRVRALSSKRRSRGQVQEQK
jgi:hypothetical protein